jgi:hypothetical protein
MRTGASSRKKGAGAKSAADRSAFSASGHRSCMTGRQFAPMSGRTGRARDNPPTRQGTDESVSGTG